MKRWLLCSRPLPLPMHKPAPNRMANTKSIDLSAFEWNASWRNEMPVWRPVVSKWFIALATWKSNNSISIRWAATAGQRAMSMAVRGVIRMSVWSPMDIPYQVAPSRKFVSFRTCSCFVLDKIWNYFFSIRGNFSSQSHAQCSFLVLECCKSLATNRKISLIRLYITTYTRKIWWHCDGLIKSVSSATHTDWRLPFR